MRLHALLIMVTGCLIEATGAQDDKLDQDMKKLQGTWKTVAVVVEGKTIEAPSRTATVTIKGDKYTVTYPPSESGETKVSESTFKIDPGKKPREINFTAAVGPDKERPSRGIYELEGDTLKICFNPDKDGERPTGFTTEAGSRLRSIVLEREAP